MKLGRLTLAACLVAMFTTPALSHELDPGYLDMRQLDAEAWQVFWRKPDVLGSPMAINARLPENCTPQTGPENTFDGTAWITGWTAICSGDLAGSAIVIEGLEQQNTDTLVRYHAQDQSPIIGRMTPTETVFVVPAAQTPFGVFATYGVLGFDHILEGWDHLLFVFALLLLIPDLRRLFWAITAFTAAHSITLALAALGHLSIPGPPVEAIIALSIVFLAIELLKRKDGQLRLSERAPWMVSFVFGLIHGLGFAGALREIGLPDQDIAIALLAFNLGVEAGQLAFVAVVVTAGLVFRKMVAGMGSITPGVRHSATTIAGYAIGGVATFWLAERLAGF